MCDYDSLRPIFRILRSVAPIYVGPLGYKIFQSLRDEGPLSSNKENCNLFCYQRKNSNTLIGANCSSPFFWRGNLFCPHVPCKLHLAPAAIVWAFENRSG